MNIAVEYQFTPVDWWIGNCWVISICSKVYWYPINKHNKEHTASGFSTKKKLIGQKKKNEIPLPMFRSIQIVIPRTGCRDFQMIACRDPDTEISKRLHTESLVPRFPNDCPFFKFVLILCAISTILETYYMQKYSRDFQSKVARELKNHYLK